MSSSGSLTSALAGLPSWLQPTADPASLDANFLTWVESAGWRAGGMVWPCEGPPILLKCVQNGKAYLTTIPPELPDALRRLHQGEPTATVTAVNGSLRVYASLTPQGRPSGVIWAEKAAGSPITDTDRNLMVLTARLVEGSPAFAAAAGPVIDTDRLMTRLQDAAVIAGRMAHDFDNILTGIMGFTDLAQPLLPPGSPAVGFLAEISKGGHRGIQFTQQLHQ